MTCVSNIINRLNQKFTYPIDILSNSRYIKILKSYINEKLYNLIDITSINKFDIYYIAIIDQSQIKNIDYIYTYFYSKIIIIDDVSENMDPKNTKYWQNLNSYYNHYIDNYNATALTFSMENFLYSGQAHSLVITPEEFETFLTNIINEYLSIKI